MLAILRILPVVLLLASCITPYRTDLQQGNVITLDMLEKLKPGMTRSQVRFVLGTPLIADPFHQDRWDYIYYYQDPGGNIQRKHLLIVFDKDVLKQIENDTPTPSTNARAL